MTPSEDQPPPAKKTRRRSILSCTHCHIVKLKCDRQRPCGSCKSRGNASNCVYNPDPKKDQSEVVPLNDTPDYGAEFVHHVAPWSYQRAPVPQMVVQRSRSKENELQQRLDKLELMIVNAATTQKSLDVQQSYPTPEECRDSSPSLNSNKGAAYHGGALRLTGSDSNYVGETAYASILAELGDLKSYYQDGQHQSQHSHPSYDTPSLERTLLARESLNHPVDKSDLLASLPLKAISDGLVKKYFDTDDPAIPVNYLLHRPTFMAEYEGHYEDPAGTPVVWLGLLFSMLCLAARFYESEHHTSSSARCEYAAMSDRFHQRANECIDLIDITNPPQGCVEFMACYLHIYAADFRGRENGSRAWFLTGDTVRLAMRMGYHRDPANYEHFSPFEIEIRRRVWQFVSQTDMLFSFQLGLPPAVRSTDYDTQSPSNYFDEQLDALMSKPAAPQPLTIKTQWTYMLSNYAILQVFRRITEHLNNLTPSAHDDVLVLQVKLLEARDAISPHYQIPPGGLDIRDPDFAKRAQLEMFYNKLRCVLHRKYMVQGFGVSVSECVDSALGLLHLQRLFHQHQIEHPKYIRWHTFSISNHDFILAATILCLYIKRFPPGDTHASHPEVIDTLKQAHAIWAEVQHTSNEANKAYHFLDRVLAQLENGMESNPVSQLQSEIPAEQFKANGLDDFLGETFDWEMWDAHFREIGFDQSIATA